MKTYYEEQTLVKTDAKELVDKAAGMMKEGYRLVHIMCTKISDSELEVTYSFDRDMKVTNLRLSCEPSGSIPSITGSYAAAFLYENEIKELFGLDISGINIDFKGTLYKKSMEKPFFTDTKSIDKVKQCQEKE